MVKICKAIQCVHYKVHVSCNIRFPHSWCPARIAYSSATDSVSDRVAAELEAKRIVSEDNTIQSCISVAGSSSGLGKHRRCDSIVCFEVLCCVSFG